MSRGMNTKPCGVLRSGRILFHAFDFECMWSTVQLRIFIICMCNEMSHLVYIYANLLTYKLRILVPIHSKYTLNDKQMTKIVKIPTRLSINFIDLKTINNFNEFTNFIIKNYFIIGNFIFLRKSYLMIKNKINFISDLYNTRSKIKIIFKIFFFRERERMFG